MGVRFPSAAATAFVTQTLVTTAETIVLSTPPLIQLFDAAVALLIFYVALTLGTAATGITVRIRAGTTLTGAVQNTGPTVTGAGGNTVIVPGAITVQAGTSSGGQFSLTLQQVAATGNAAISEGTLYAMVL